LFRVLITWRGVRDGNNVDARHLKTFKCGHSAGTKTVDANTTRDMAHLGDDLTESSGGDLGGDVCAFATILEAIHATGACVHGVTLVII